MTKKQGWNASKDRPEPLSCIYRKSQSGSPSAGLPGRKGTHRHVKGVWTQVLADANNQHLSVTAYGMPHSWIPRTGTALSKAASFQQCNPGRREGHQSTLRAAGGAVSVLKGSVWWQLHCPLQVPGSSEEVVAGRRASPLERACLDVGLEPQDTRCCEGSCCGWPCGQGWALCPGTSLSCASALRQPRASRGSAPVSLNWFPISRRGLHCNHCIQFQSESVESSSDG